jgi:hypothetical protein
MIRKRRSVIWKVSLEEFKSIVERSSSYREVLSFFHLENKGGNHRTLKERIIEDAVDDAHIRNKPQNHAAVKANSIPLELILVNNGPYSIATSSLRKRLIKAGLLEEKCAQCGCDPIWQSKRLVLQLDHIDGSRKNNILSNLRLLCPNCHSQTPTFAGKKMKKIRRCNCGAEIKKYSRVCAKCASFFKRKIDRPSKEELATLLENHSWCFVGRLFGVTDNAIRKWARLYNII